MHTDHQGSVRAITDLGGIVVNSYAYDAYGNAEEAVEGLAQRFRYTGREWDEVTGLYHYRARAFDAGTGRFLQEDPIWFDAGDLNVYRMTWNNPVNWTDPSGMSAASDYRITAGIGTGAILAYFLLDHINQGPVYKTMTGLAGDVSSEMGGGAIGGWLLGGLSSVVDWAFLYGQGLVGMIEGFKQNGSPYGVDAVYSQRDGPTSGGGSGAGAASGAGAGGGGNDDERCKKLQGKLQNIRRDIINKDREILENLGGLPQFGPGPNLSTVQGHHRKLNRLWKNLRDNEDEYHRRCK